MDKKPLMRQINTYFKARRTTFLGLAVVLLVLIPLIFGAYEQKDVSNSLKDLGISGMKIKEFDIDGNKFDKIKEEKNNIEVSSEYFYKGNGIVKQDIWIKNKENKKKTIDFSTTIEIDYQRVMFGGRNYILSENPITFNSYYKDGQLVVPNIFMGKENKRINFKDIAEKGGYALGYELGGKYYIEFRIDNLNLNALEELYIDPIFVNATDGFSTAWAGASNPIGIATNGTDTWVTDGDDKAIYHFKASDGSNLTGSITPVNVGSDFPYRIWANDTDIGIVDNIDKAYYQVKIADGSNRTGMGFHVEGLTGAGGVLSVTSNNTDLWFGDNTVQTFVSHVYNRINQTDGFWFYQTSQPLYGLTIRRQEFWLLYRPFIEHYNSLGINQTDGFWLDSFGIDGAFDIATDDKDLWIIDNTDDFVYHLEAGEDVIVTLNSPTNTETVLSSEIKFNCSAIAVDAGTMDNITLWHNISGTWKKNQTLDVSGIGAVDVNATFNVSNIPTGIYKWNCEAFSSESYSANATSNFTFSFKSLRENSATFNSTTFETNSEVFEINVTYNYSIFNLGAVAILNYDGINYTSTQLDLENGIIFTRRIDIPLVNSTTNKTFFWQIVLSDETGSFLYNSIVHNQTISNISLYTSGCVDGTNLSLNFSSYNEENLIGLADFAFYGTFQYWLGSGNVKKNFSISNSTIPNNNLFCINPNNKTYFSNAQIQYEKTGFVKRTHYLINASITNTTNEIGLYLLNSTKSTSFIMNVINEVRVPIKESYIYVQRYYPGTGEYHTVEMSKTDISGNTVAHFESETEDYKIIIFKSGVILYESDKAKIFCGETPCILNFQTEATPPTTWTDVGNVSNLIWSLIYNEILKTYEYSYVDTTGSTSYGRLLVYRSDKSPTNIICNNSDTSSAATIICNVTLYDGTIYAEAFISRSPEILVWITSIVNKAVKAIFGMEGLFLAVIILMVIAMIGLWNPAVGVVMLIAGMISINLLQIASFGIVTVMGIAVIGIIILWEMKK